ncbi:MAG TPA: nucleoside hydrolase [Anaerolineae bacterium]|nr:nucleoside hydrolase [Anaerolineae bacterium]HOR00980.1 nucleoside hydrolase [Anaerolineae bacterium]HPL27733.1 nucleoside hydrolase [Anaerolineae bacterium]
MKMRLVLVLLTIVLLLAACRPTALTATPIPTRPPVPTAAPPPVPAATPAGQLHVILDDDGSPDGTTALFYFLSHPQAWVDGVAVTYGEAHPAAYIQHLGRVLDDLGIHDIALGAGQDGLPPGGTDFPAWLRDAADSYWGLPLPYPERTYPAQDAAALIVALAHRAPEPVTILVSGPCTDLARALRMDPAIREHIAAVYLMGGAVHVAGNLRGLLPNAENTVAEWNIAADPRAAQEVFQSGLRICLVPLDATNQVSISRADIEGWRSGSRAANMAADLGGMLTRSAQGSAIWDLLTAAIMVEPDLCPPEPLHLEVVTDPGATSGQTIVVAGAQPNVDVCLHPDVNRIKQTLAEVFAAGR